MQHIGFLYVSGLHSFSFFSNAWYNFSMKYDVVIIGSGAAGLASAMYAGRYKMSSLVIGKEFGGETATAGSIENYPGILAIDGYDLVLKMKEQAEKYGAKVIEEEVVAVENKGVAGFVVKTKEGNSYEGSALIFAIGSQRRHLGLPHEQELVGKGVHYCWTCDGPLYEGKTVAMIGGGDSSVKGVNFLAEYAKKIYLIARGDTIVAEPVNLERMQKQGDKVEVLLLHEVKEIVGEQRLEKLVLSSPKHDAGKELDDLVVDGMFVEIGFEPNKELPRLAGVELDERGYIKIDKGAKTNIPGVFAAGDGTNFFGSFKQDITASALGAVAATSAYEYIKTNQPTAGPPWADNQ